MKYADRMDLARARADLYYFLGGLYSKPPSEGFLQQAKNENFAQHLRHVFGRQASSMLRYLAQIGDVIQAQRELKLEYDALFRVPGVHYIHPYESVYRDRCSGEGITKPGLVWGESTAAVSRAYAQAGTQISKETKELPDFIGLELNFMGFLCEGEAQAWEGENEEEAYRYRTLQKEFLSQHLATWAYDLCRSQFDKARSDFYRGLARMTESYIQEEEKGIETTLSE
ncbi:MAG: molecular chaperone [Anaerolineae bacterium]